MRISLLIAVFANLAILFALLMLPAAFVPLVLGQPDAAMPFLISILLLGAGGGAMRLAVRDMTINLSRTDLCLAALAAWFGASFAAALPFAFTPDYTLIDAWFESVSWLTTTGALLVPSAEVSPALIFWRAELQWVGGFAAILTGLLILLPLGVGGMELQTAMPASAANASEFAQHLRRIIQRMLPFYLLFTFACFLLLLLAGTPPDYALLFAFSALATGNLNPAGDLAITYPYAVRPLLALFLIIGALSLALHRTAFTSTPAAYFRDTEGRAFLVFAALLAVFFFFALMPALEPSALITGFIDAALIAASLLSTSASLPPDLLPHMLPFSGLTLVLILIGGTTLSTAGGLKILRLLLLTYYQGRRELVYIRDPHSVVPINYPSGVPIKLPLAETVWVLFLLTIFGLSLLSVLLALTGMDFPTSLAAAAAALANAGPAVYLVDPSAPSWSSLAPSAKLFLTLGMIAGRIEFLLMASIINPLFWKH